MIGVRAEHLAHTLAMSIERRETVASLLEVPYYHPVVEEMLQSALLDAAKKLEIRSDHPLGLRLLG